MTPYWPCCNVALHLRALETPILANMIEIPMSFFLCKGVVVVVIEIEDSCIRKVLSPTLQLGNLLFNFLFSLDYSRGFFWGQLGPLFSKELVFRHVLVKFLNHPTLSPKLLKPPHT